MMDEMNDIARNVKSLGQILDDYEMGQATEEHIAGLGYNLRTLGKRLFDLLTELDDNFDITEKPQNQGEAN